MIRILVVEDDAGHRLILKNRLTEHGWEVVTADSGARGLVDARSGGFDALLVAADLDTGIDGFEVCRRLKSIPETNATPVVLFNTQPGGQEQVDRAWQAGCDGFAAGQELSGLENLVKHLVRQRRQLVELAEQVRTLQEQIRRGGTPNGREAEPLAKDSVEHQNALRELAAGHAEGVLLVDGEGTVKHADRGACELLGARLEGRHLGSLVPASGLEAFVRDARIEARDGFRFEVQARRGRTPRHITASVLPFVVMPGEHDHGLRVVLLHDAARRRLAAELLRVPERSVPRVELGTLLEAARECYRPERLVGDSALMRGLRELVVEALDAGGPVLILGARGTGHERVARTLHYAGSSTGSFVPCAAAAHGPTEIEVELFGCVKGAVAGALQDRPGLLHFAQDGTLFLEEIGTLPAAAQERLVAFLREGTLQRQGSRKAERLDVRLIASSTLEPDELVAQQKLNPELARLLSETTLRLPTLAEIRDDVPALALSAVQRVGLPRHVSSIADEALAMLRQHDWPGNLAELEQTVERAAARASGGTIQVHDLSGPLRDKAPELTHREVIPARRPSGPAVQGTHSVVQAQPMPSLPQHLRGPAKELRAWDITDEDPISLDLYEKKVLLRALDHTGGDRLAAARLLQVGKSTLYRKLKRFGIH